MVSLLVVDMFNIFCLMHSIRLGTYGVDISKTFVFFTRSAPREPVTRSLQNVLCKLLVFNDTQLGQRNGPTTRYATHFVDVR